MIIRPAAEEDIAQLMALKSRLQLGASGNESDGFLVTCSADSVRELLQNGVAFVAATPAQIVGYITGYSKRSPLFHMLLQAAGTFTWDAGDPTLRDNLFYIDGIGVIPEYRSGGTALALFEALRGSQGRSGFLTAVVERPVANRRSATVISRCGFRRVGQFNAPECFGWKNYQSGIYFRER